jgi:hypothetical protein
MRLFLFSSFSRLEFLDNATLRAPLQVTPQLKTPCLIIREVRLADIVILLDAGLNVQV